MSFPYGLIQNLAWNVVNTDIMPFNINEKTLDAKGKLNLCRKQLYLPKFIKCLIVKIDKNLDWKNYANKIASEIVPQCHSSAIVTKLWYFIHKKTLTSVYFTILLSYQTYSGIVT